ncbi:MAG: mechanosensitive ion channel family protein [Candidatus Woesearchaeota archaeon]|nr:mechanosensitive ion channel family protein [Candidatus Woesearchaeota archaeon]
MDSQLLNEVFIPIIIILAFIVIGELLNFVIKGLEKMASGTKTRFDDIFLAHLRSPVRLIFILIGVFIATRYVQPDFNVLGFKLTSIFIAAMILVAAHLAVRILNSILGLYRTEASKHEKARINETMYPFIRKAIAIIVYTVAMIMIFSHLGIEIGPFLAGLGIAGLAVALALQDTLSNVFSGIYMATDKPIRIGDYIELDSGVKGFIEDISWRTTRIRNFNNNMVFIPNSKLAQAIITNYNLPEEEISFFVPVSIAFRNDLDKVEKVTLKVAKEAMKDDLKVYGFEPFVTYGDIVNSTIIINANFKAKSFADFGKLRNNFLMNIAKEYQKSRVEMPANQMKMAQKK